jgi:transcriptional regulator with XRE-family HTH domain
MESRRLIARNLKQIRLVSRLSQEALALQAGVDRTYVSGLERGLRNPSVDILDRLAKVLSAKTIDFLSEAAADSPPALPRGRRAKLVRRPKSP